MYKELAKYWPLISNSADYAYPSTFWKKTLRELLGEGRHKILELGVGGGHNLSHLVSDFDAVAVDLSPDMIEQAEFSTRMSSSTLETCALTAMGKSMMR